MNGRNGLATSDTIQHWGADTVPTATSPLEGEDKGEGESGSIRRPEPHSAKASRRKG
jgi:hypothetical protein